ncbi:MAG: RecQ family ATP-dependent DNA helicase [Planctomycetes bacterium]|nr:RecQ family ATP-dependent DNA helicase [Planctomycetota bacterium]
MPSHPLDLHLAAMLGPAARFRPGQREAALTLVENRGRLLLVQRTGWGKSLVYWLATRLLRDRGAGFTLIVSPLLALMRNQVESARRIGVRAFTLNSSNREEWAEVSAALDADGCDALLVSPERLVDDRFAAGALPRFREGRGLLVVDEAHCISDWGHDFRTAYRRIARLSRTLDPGAPVLAVTATANDRVVADVLEQLGPTMALQRGGLGRPSLRLQNLDIPASAGRLTFLAENVPAFRRRLGHAGVIYALTIPAAERIAAFLTDRGLRVMAYHSEVPAEARADLEQRLLADDVDALAATVALGMGFDKPDLGFVIHHQTPPSVVHYYQQVGRAGRDIERAYGILLSGAEETAIQDYFIDTAFPTTDVMAATLAALPQTDHAGVRARDVAVRVNARPGDVDRALDMLEFDGVADKSSRGWRRRDGVWNAEAYRERARRVTTRRRFERDQMRAYLVHAGCLMRFLTRALDDPDTAPCGVCANCQGKGYAPPDALRFGPAEEFLRREHVAVEPRRRWPPGWFESTVIQPEHRAEPGCALAWYGDEGYGSEVKAGKYDHGRFSDTLVVAAAKCVREQWRPDPPPEWITSIPSLRRPNLVRSFAERLADALGLEFAAVFEARDTGTEQKASQSSNRQAESARAALALAQPPRSRPVLLVDDIVDSRWMMTWAAYLLRSAGSGPVHPFAIARATPRLDLSASPSTIDG